MMEFSRTLLKVQSCFGHRLTKQHKKSIEFRSETLPRRHLHRTHHPSFNCLHCPMVGRRLCELRSESIEALLKGLGLSRSLGHRTNSAGTNVQTLFRCWLGAATPFP